MAKILPQRYTLVQRDGFTEVRINLVGQAPVVTLLDNEDALRLQEEGWYLSPHAKGYITACVRYGVGAKNRRNHPLHRLIMGVPPHAEEVVDHINFDRRDNRRSNLMVVSRTINQLHRKEVVVSTRAKSGLRGVAYISSPHQRGNKRWRGYVRGPGGFAFSRHFLTAEEASNAVQDFLRERGVHAS